MAPLAASGRGGWAREAEQAVPSGRVVYGRVPRDREEYAARRALFLQSYRLSTRCDQEEEEEAMAMAGLRGRMVRRLREAGVAGRAAAASAASSARGAARWWLGAGLGRAWRGWRRPLRLSAPGPSSLLGLGGLGCFGVRRRPCGEYHYLQGFA